MQWTITTNDPKEVITKIALLARDRAKACDARVFTLRTKRDEMVARGQAKELRDFADFLEKYVKVEPVKEGA